MAQFIATIRTLPIDQDSNIRYLDWLTLSNPCEPLPLARRRNVSLQHPENIVADSQTFFCCTASHGLVQFLRYILHLHCAHIY